MDRAFVMKVSSSMALRQGMKDHSIELDYGSWCDELREQELELEKQFASQLGSDEVPIDPLRMAQEISRFVDEDTLLIGDGGDIVAHRTLGQQQITRRRCLFNVTDHGRRTTGEVGSVNHFGAALRMS